MHIVCRVPKRNQLKSHIKNAFLGEPEFDPLQSVIQLWHHEGPQDTFLPKAQSINEVQHGQRAINHVCSKV